MNIEEIRNAYNNFMCAAISSKYNEWEKTEIKTVAEELKHSIDVFLKEIESEKCENRLKLSIPTDI